MENEKPQMVRFRGREMAIEDAKMELTKVELEEVEMTLPDGRVIRPFRFNEQNPEIGRDEHGILSV